MNESIVRIESITLSNFKNVVNGTLSFENTRKPFVSSILALYGQNGSGKTALIDAIELLKYALSGQTIPANFCDYINIDADSASLKYEFKVENMETKALYSSVYEVSIRKDLDDSAQNLINDSEIHEKYKVTLFDEVLSYSYDNGEKKKKMLPVIDTRTSDAFAPKTKYDALTGKNRSLEMDLLVAKKLAGATSRSFVFSKEMLAAIRENCKEAWHIFLINSLVDYGHLSLFVINTANSGLISLNALPLAFRYEEKTRGAAGSLAFRLDGVSVIKQENFDIMKKVIDNMNIVLTQIIPGLTISIKDLGAQIMKDGQSGYRIQMISQRNGKEIPLQYESDGIKKIVSILQLLIVVYNNPSITVAIDELDSGVFEYLLGEILRIISEKGKGQLIFTSHNLRPLETLDRGFIAFTTTNPSNRYMRLNNVKTNNNLRDFYYRDIVLGEQSEVVYEPTNNYKIALAFREAGEMSGS